MNLKWTCIQLLNQNRTSHTEPRNTADGLLERRPNFDTWVHVA